MRRLISCTACCIGALFLACSQQPTSSPPRALSSPAGSLAPVESSIPSPGGTNGITSRENGSSQIASASANSRVQSRKFSRGSEREDSYLGGHRFQLISRAQALDWWTFSDVLVSNGEPDRLSEMVEAGCTGKDHRDKCVVGVDKLILVAFYLTSDSDPFVERMWAMTAKGSIRLVFYHIPPDGTLECKYEPDSIFKDSCGTLTVRGREANITESSTTSRGPEPWQKGGNVNRRRIVFTDQVEKGHVQWSVEVDPRVYSLDQHKQFVEALVKLVA